MRFAFWVAVVAVPLASSSCVRWDADKHFAEEKRVVDEQLARERSDRLKTAEENVAMMRHSVISGARVGMNATALQDIAGYRYDPLARTSSGDQIWERRRYLLSHVVAARWGSFSLESKLCDPNVELFTVTLVNGIVRDLDFAY